MIDPIIISSTPMGKKAPTIQSDTDQRGSPLHQDERGIAPSD